MVIIIITIEGKRYISAYTEDEQNNGNTTDTVNIYFLICC
jgi:hypothetical protein